MSVRELIRSKELLFSSEIIKRFIREIFLYPTGSYVRLNTKVTGIIVDTNKKNPLRPVVKILVDTNGKEAKESNAVNLDKNQLLYIVDSIPKEEIVPELSY